MKLTALIIILLTFFNTKAQRSTKELKIKEVGWTLWIPADSKFLNAAQFDTIQSKAVNAINEAYGTTEEDFKEVKSLFTIREGQFNIMGSTINPYDSSMFKTWHESYAASKFMILDLINQQGPEIKVVDTASSSEKISGLSFEKFYLKTFYPSQNLTMHTYWFYRKHGVYDFSISISYSDENIGKQYLNIVRNSKFEN